MGIATLTMISGLLDGFRAGQWLSESLQGFSMNDPSLAVLVSASTEQDRKEVLPEGTGLPAHLTILQGDETPDYIAKAVLENDLWIWVVSAMRRFPADYAAGLRAARKDLVPIWAVVTRLERLNDPQGFHDTIAPEMLKQLPAHSRVIAGDNPENLSVVHVICEMLSVEGAALAEAGRERRMQNLEMGLLGQIAHDRKHLTEDLERSIRLSETARKGANACVRSAGHTAITLLPGAEALKNTIGLLVKDLEGLVDSLRELLDQQALVREIREKVARWETEKWEPQIDGIIQSASAGIQRWCAESGKCLEEYFLPLADKMSTQDALIQAAKPDCKKVLNEASPILGSLKQSSMERIRDLYESLDRDFVLSLIQMVRKVGSARVGGKEPRPQSGQGSMQRPGLNPGLQVLHALREAEKTRLKQLLSAEIGKFRQAMTKVLRDNMASINPILQNATEDCANACLDLATEIIEESKAKLDLLDQAEDILRNARMDK